ncbi:hypothetical protein [Bacillus timonensis]|nr:hypothetical protein [Bacillus timonensis]
MPDWQSGGGAKVTQKVETYPIGTGKEVKGNVKVGIMPDWQRRRGER